MSWDLAQIQETRTQVWPFHKATFRLAEYGVSCIVRLEIYARTELKAKALHTVPNSLEPECSSPEFLSSTSITSPDWGCSTLVEFLKR